MPIKTKVALQLVSIALLLCILPCALFFCDLVPVKITSSSEAVASACLCNNHDTELSPISFVIMVFFIFFLFFLTVSRLAETAFSVYQPILAYSIEKPPLA